MMKIYIDHVTKQIRIHKLLEHTEALYQKITKKGNYYPPFSSEDANELDKIDQILTDIMLSAENLYARRHTYKQEWSPQQHLIARTFSYWKQKSIMESKIFLTGLILINCAKKHPYLTGSI
jgi:hypothetical protein